MGAAPVLFTAGRLAARELQPHELPQLQALFDADPGYFLTIGGQPPRPDEARQEYDEMPPPELGHSRRWFLGVFERDDAGGERLAGMAIVVADLCAATVWHIALFFVATRLHGRGTASALYLALEDWVRAQGACWLRLGVVVGNAPAERFWARHGYRQTRLRTQVPAGDRLNTVRVMHKPLAGGGERDYLALVPRDAPESDLP